MTPTRDAAAAGPAPAVTSSTADGIAGVRVLLVGDDTTLAGLLQEWLAAEGCTVVTAADGPGHNGSAGAAAQPFDLAIMDIPFARQGGAERVQRLAAQHPGLPVLALSASFFAGVDCCGPVARALGVACVLPKPAPRDALVQALRRIVQHPRPR